MAIYNGCPKYKELARLLRLKAMPEAATAEPPALNEANFPAPPPMPGQHASHIRPPISKPLAPPHSATSTSPTITPSTLPSTSVTPTPLSSTISLPTNNLKNCPQPSTLRENQPASAPQRPTPTTESGNHC
ncbi:proline-rich receptor-like protein kinase PERK2 [Ischnura elegans]|uniref:proline-rich receptor-like protein kinase PERK2 n=1 Tax=Ischnura elegans TaxID=197161 RepID=UPI001ED87B25|nr:proline-rich receptor-like protein kinase PERK2 [Ischnura elegans]